MKRLVISVGMVIGIGVLAVGCSSDCPQSVSPKPATPASQVPDFVTRTVKLPITTKAQQQALEKRLKEMGFKVCWFKDGLNLSGHSLVGRYNNVDFRFSIVHRMSNSDGQDAISVTLEAFAPSREKAEDASRKLSAYLDQQEKNGQPVVGSDRKPAQQR